MTKHEAYNAALAADHRWSELLRRYFGKRAGDVRYTKQGEGQPGSDLHEAWQAFRKSTEIWRSL